MRKSIIILMLSVIVLGSACDKFLEEVPKDKISPANYYKNAADAEAAINGAYAALQNVRYYSRFWVTSSILASDGSYSRIAPTGTRGVICTLNDAGMITSTSYNSLIWEGIWQAINRANAVLSNVPDIDMDATLKARILAEAKFLRALSYFNMVRRWGGIPIVLKETSTSDLVELQVSRNMADEVYQQIFTDLSEAATDLPYIKDYSGDDVGRASKEAAQGLLAKAKLYKKEWADAQSNAIAVINSPSNLDLMDEPQDNWWMGNGNMDNNKESIFEVQFNGIPPQGHKISANFEPNNNGWGIAAWGTIHANLYFFNKFSDTDKRKEATFLTQYPSYTDGHTIYWWENTYPLPHINKYRDPNNKVNDGQASNIKVLRLADVLLVAAEATNEKDGPANAYQYVNRVRARAGLPALSGMTKDELREAIYLEFRKELCYEGQDYEELARTGKLLANKAAAADYVIPPFVDNDGNVVPLSDYTLGRIQRYQPTHESMELDAWNTVFPLPQIALDKNPNLEQNPGYSN